VLSAEDQLLASVRQLVDVQSRALTLDIGLHRALGGGWQEVPVATDRPILCGPVTPAPRRDVPAAPEFLNFPN
jgi:hypothetical protein